MLLSFVLFALETGISFARSSGIQQQVISTTSLSTGPPIEVFNATIHLSQLTNVDVDPIKAANDQEEALVNAATDAENDEKRQKEILAREAESILDTIFHIEEAVDKSGLHSLNKDHSALGANRSPAPKDFADKDSDVHNVTISAATNAMPENGLQLNVTSQSSNESQDDSEAGILGASPRPSNGTDVSEAESLSQQKSSDTISKAAIERGNDSTLDQEETGSHPLKQVEERALPTQPERQKDDLKGDEIEPLPLIKAEEVKAEEVKAEEVKADEVDEEGVAPGLHLEHTTLSQPKLVDEDVVSVTTEGGGLRDTILGCIGIFIFLGCALFALYRWHSHRRHPYDLFAERRGLVRWGPSSASASSPTQGTGWNVFGRSRVTPGYMPVA